MRDSCHSFLSCDPGQENGPMRIGVKGHSRWRLMVGACFGWSNRWPLPKKGLRAQDGGWWWECVFWGNTADQEGKISRAQWDKEETAMMVLEMWLLMTPASTLRHRTENDSLMFLWRQQSLRRRVLIISWKWMHPILSIRGVVCWLHSSSWYVDWTSWLNNTEKPNLYGKSFLLYQEHGDRQLPVDGFRDSRWFWTRGIRGATETTTMFVGWDDTPCVYTTLTGDTTPISIPIGGFPSGIGIDR